MKPIEIQIPENKYIRLALKIGAATGLWFLASSPAVMNFLMQYGSTNWLQRSLWSNNPQLLLNITGGISGIGTLIVTRVDKDVKDIASDIQKGFKTITNVINENKHNTKDKNQDSNKVINTNIIAPVLKDTKKDSAANRITKKFFSLKFQECEFYFIKQALVTKGFKCVVKGSHLYASNTYTGVKVVFGKTYKEYVCIIYSGEDCKISTFDTQDEFIQSIE